MSTLFYDKLSMRLPKSMLCVMVFLFSWGGVVLADDEEDKDLEKFPVEMNAECPLLKTCLEANFAMPDPDNGKLVYRVYWEIEGRDFGLIPPQLFPQPEYKWAREFFDNHLLPNLAEYPLELEGYPITLSVKQKRIERIIPESPPRENQALNNESDSLLPKEPHVPQVHLDVTFDKDTRRKCRCGLITLNEDFIFEGKLILPARDSSNKHIDYTQDYIYYNTMIDVSPEQTLSINLYLVPMYHGHMNRKPFTLRAQQIYKILTTKKKDQVSFIKQEYRNPEPHYTAHARYTERRRGSQNRATEMEIRNLLRESYEQF